MIDSSFELTAIYDWVLISLLYMIRPGAFILSSPLYQSRSLPLNVRIILATALGFLLASQNVMPELSQLNSSQFVFIILVEIAIGLCGGLLLQIYFNIAALAGEYAASSMGLGFARMIDFTNSGQGATVGQFLSLVFLVIFLSVDGHLLSIAILMETYKTYGIGDTFNIASFAQSSLNAGSQLFVIAALMALPIVGGIFLVNIALGILTKVAPQMNLFSVGFPATILVGFFLLWASLPSMANLMREIVLAAESSLESSYNNNPKDIEYE